MQNHNNSFSTADSDVVSEWIYFAVLADHTTQSIIELLELTLASTFLDEPLISEAEIDEAINMDLSLVKADFDKGELTQQHYKNACRQVANRNLVKQELINAGAGEQFEEGLAACEFLAAILGVPTDGFLSVLASYGEEFINTFTLLRQKLNITALAQMMPKALTVVEQIQQNQNEKLLHLSGENDVENWLSSIKQIEHNLQKVVSH